jgi:SAM-dependent methyltransferase
MTTSPPSESRPTALAADRFEVAAAPNYYDVATENLLASPLVRRVADAINRGGGNVLDIGCGRGAFSKLLAGTIDYTGFDLSLDPTDPSTNRTPNVSWGDACRPFPYAEASFQSVVSFWCLEHLPDPRVTLREAARVLAPGGTLYFVFPNYDNPLRRCPSWWCDRGAADDSLSALVRRPRPVNVARQARRRGAYFVRQFAKQLWLDLTRSPVFEINRDPAYTHLPWARDRDAIHIASGRSVVLELGRLGLAARHVRPGGGLSRLPVLGSFFRREPEYGIEATKLPARAE